MAPKHKSRDAGNSENPKGSSEVLPLSEKGVCTGKNAACIGFGTVRGFGHPLPQTRGPTARFLSVDLLRFSSVTTTLLYDATSPPNGCESTSLEQHQHI